MTTRASRARGMLRLGLITRPSLSVGPSRCPGSPISGSSPFGTCARVETAIWTLGPHRGALRVERCVGKLGSLRSPRVHQLSQAIGTHQRSALLRARARQSVTAAGGRSSRFDASCMAASRRRVVQSDTGSGRAHHPRQRSRAETFEQRIRYVHLSRKYWPSGTGRRRVGSELAPRDTLRRATTQC